MFDPGRANLSRIAGSRDLFVSAVLHEAFVEVVEKGTEAAAATAVVVTLAAAPMEPEAPVVFRADHPFVFAIVDRTTGLSLFWGCVVR